MSFFAQEHKAYVRIGFESCFTPEEAQLIRKYIGMNHTVLENFFKKLLLKEVERYAKEDK